MAVANRSGKFKQNIEMDAIDSYSSGYLPRKLLAFLHFNTNTQSILQLDAFPKSHDGKCSIGSTDVERLILGELKRILYSRYRLPISIEMRVIVCL